MQNKPNLRNDKMNINAFITMRYANSYTGSGQKTKPIQTQFNPKQTQLKPKQTQFKPNQSQFEFVSDFETCPACQEPVEGVEGSYEL